MKKNFHPENSLVTFKCSSCESVFRVLSTIKKEEVPIEVCSGCHPFYLGKTNVIRVTGRAEKLINKFNTGKKVANKEIKPEPVKKTKRQTKIKQTLSDIGL